MTEPYIENVLADRYASAAMKQIWSAEGRIMLEREIWIAVLKAQRDLGIPVSARAIADYERVKNRVNLASIRRREKITRHDVKARIEEFCALAGHEHIHKGMTSRDLTENTEQVQIRRSLDLVLMKAAAVTGALARRAMQYRRLPLTARTHNVPAQPTTWGKRLAMFGEETLRAARRLDSLRADYPARGLKGAVGTQLDPWTLFDGRTDRVSAWEQRVMRHLGFRETLKNTGQVYPRSLDFEVVAALYQLACGPSNFARTLRLMAGHELASEGFAKGQVGSSAMPHKMNSRSCERVNGFQTILRGHVTMAAALAGDQWNEGDVSCSVVRRALLPDVFFVIDGLLDTTLTVLNQMETHEGVINRENERGMPFLATTTILMEAVKAGAGREQAHEAIREHATAVIRDLRDGRIADNDLADRLAADARLKLNRAAIDRVIVRAGRLTGRAGEQVAIFAREAKAFLRRIPGAADYRPGAIL